MHVKAFSEAAESSTHKYPHQQAHAHGWINLLERNIVQHIAIYRHNLEWTYGMRLAVGRSGGSMWTSPVRARGSIWISIMRIRICYAYTCIFTVKPCITETTAQATGIMGKPSNSPMCLCRIDSIFHPQAIAVDTRINKYQHQERTHTHTRTQCWPMFACFLCMSGKRLHPFTTLCVMYRRPPQGFACAWCCLSPWEYSNHNRRTFPEKGQLTHVTVEYDEAYLFFRVRCGLWSMSTNSCRQSSGLVTVSDSGTYPLSHRNNASIMFRICCHAI